MNIARTAQNRASTHDRLRQAALDLFTENGYQSTSLRDLAARLGVQAGSLYNHIEDKQSLLFELMEDCMSDLISSTHYSLRRVRGKQSGLHAFISAFVEFQASEKKKVLLFIRERSNLSPEQRQRLSALRSTYASSLKTIIKLECHKTTLDEARLKFLANGIIGMLESIPTWDEGDRDLPTQQLVEQLTDIVSAAISRMGKPSAG
ncbi:TetR/AcrR family transcriptional regulator [Pseudomonas sp. BN417]|uniref:TetR/AcrR family transcriptional regulator n=1 Tax=Pseudomonas sp. BN417 TaxID=2567890 RepID=UPI0024560DB8|nr:TetR/AcrR family transcriptional regulator [Pseudomonas sp. BN417]MDH4555967.1 TetR/AcrR family transcriptional regulator [Pseudomonas sp. BN417]